MLRKLTRPIPHSADPRRSLHGAPRLGDMATGTGWWRPGRRARCSAGPARPPSADAAGPSSLPLPPVVLALQLRVAFRAPPELGRRRGRARRSPAEPLRHGPAVSPPLESTTQSNQINQSINPSPPPTSPPPSTMPAPVRPTTPNPTSSSPSFAPPPALLRLPHAVCRAPLLPPAARRRWEEGARQRGRWRRDECAGGRREEQDGGDKVGDPLTTST
jgi:hypothetical protein